MTARSLHIAHFFCIFVWLLFSAVAAGAEISRYNVAVVEDGHYRLRFDDLGPTRRAVPSAGLALTERGIAVPMHIDDGGDGIFESGDSLRFVGRRLAGTFTWHDPHSRYNIYQLRLNAATASPAAVPLRGPLFEHLEEDRQRVVLAYRDRPEQADTWYWQRITSLAGDSFRHELRWKSRPRELRLGVAGLSRDRYAEASELPQHRLQVFLDGALVAQHSWNGQDSAEIVIPDLAPAVRHRDRSRLELIVPSRRLPDGRELVDAVLLDWIEVEYEDPPLPLPAIVDRSGGRRQIVAGEWLQPAWVDPVEEQPGPRGELRRADYLMITHPRLREALEPLAAFHRGRGLEVAVVDTQWIYNSFNHGIAAPEAIRDFIAHAWAAATPPRPRFVLLAGDASWDRDPRRRDTRNLVPTFPSYGLGGPAASDNALVSIAGDDWRPDLAVGRLPAANATELTAMVEKLLRYGRANAPEGRSAARGDADMTGWRTRMTWISDSDPQFQQISNELAVQMQQRGFGSERIYPDPAVHVDDQQRVLDAFDRGSVLLHFLGHGGRFVWRTGPIDLRNATDLFSVRDIPRLARGRGLPLVLSMTCSSGPFDHPVADSMAEALLRGPDRGAVGVVAASRRVPPSRRFSAQLLDELTTKGATIGEALMRAKQREPRRTLVESYNLLGDPALRLVQGLPL